ncbi:MAG: trigger factor [Oscillospiraceae bacterium]|jgi:trigger factor|nr:trigger factor [Oscillospiraceae bacterium]
MSLRKQEVKENSHVLLEIEVGAEAFAAAYNDAYKKHAKNITVPGFRKGKAPKSLVEKMYGKESFYDDAVNAVYPDALDEAIKEAGIDSASRRIALDVVSVGEEGLVFTAVIPVKPAVSIDGYKGIKAEKLVVEIGDEAIDSEIESARKKSARIVGVDDRVAQDGDIAVIDYAGFLGDNQFAGGTAEKQELKLGSGQFIPGFEEQVIGHSVDEDFDINVTFPEEYGAEDLAGQSVVFKIHLHELKVEELPEVDDDFASEVSDFETLDEYKADIKSKLTEQADSQAKTKLDEALMSALVDLLDADIPEEMYEDTIDREVEQWGYRLQANGLNVDDYFKYTGSTMEMLRDNFKNQAVARVKLRLALEEIAKLEAFEATDEEINAEYEKLAAQYGREIDEIKAIIPSEEIAADTIVEKAMNLVRDTAVVTEVDSLSADEEAE